MKNSTTRLVRKLLDCCGSKDRDWRGILSDLLIAAGYQIENFDWLTNQGGQENLTKGRENFVLVHELLNNGRIL